MLDTNAVVRFLREIGVDEEIINGLSDLAIEHQVTLAETVRIGLGVFFANVEDEDFE